MKPSEVKPALESAGFRVIRVVVAGRWYEVEKGGEPGCVLRQSDSAWHWFGKTVAATASGSSPGRCDTGGLGDAIGTDSEERAYRRLLLNPPARLLREYDGVYAASSQVFNG